MILPTRRVSIVVAFGLAACAAPPSPVEAPTLAGPAGKARAEPAETSAGGSSGIVADADASTTPSASAAASDERAADGPASDADFDAGALAAITSLVGRLAQLDGGVYFGSGSLTMGSGPGAGGSFGSGVFVGSGVLGSSDAGAVVSANLSPEQIRRVVVAHIGALRACYELEAQKDASLAGKIVLSWRIDPTGSVPSARVSSTTMNNARVEACLVRQVRSWRFPQSSAGAAATFPFVFGTH